jgi:hypothetical protein
MNKNVSEINRALSVGDTGAILVVETGELPVLVDTIARHFPKAEQTVLIDFRQYRAPWLNAGWGWGKISQVIEQPETAVELELLPRKVSAVLVGPVNLLYNNPALETYSDVWRTIRRAIAVSESTKAKIFFFTSKNQNLNRWRK